MPPDEITLGEIARRLDRLDTHIAEALRDVVQKALYDAESRALRSDLDDLRRDVMSQAMTRR